MNGVAHKTVTGISIAAFLAGQEQRDGEASLRPLAGGAAGALLASLPDLLEPPVHPNHRQFFHSLLLAGVLVAGFIKLREYKPTSPGAALLRWLGLIGTAAYLIHLAMDATTAKSLPVLGTFR